ncbi:biotin/lipoyl-binding carrier protein [Pseudooceanicola aestuarii]|uniref:biotin/lipoyl-binding carrier protein n=1 Tax=Pseudooceanicola aestuarii TaxID=2697319 RepID=UPI0013CF6503|nr:biotin/lipoyl-binding carrier protein [Pseudooceanicola aestuarii]
MADINIESELTGNVWKIVAKEGDNVAEGDTLLILESMKMEIPLMSSDDGVIKQIKVKEGDILNEGDVAVILTA